MRDPALLVLTRQVPGAKSGQEAGEADVHPVMNLARSLAAHHSWSGVSGGRLLVREQPRPLLAAVGHFDGAARSRFEALSRRLQQPEARRIGYERAEEDCGRLAAKLRETFGSHALEELGFTALPRGGLIVLGMLSYVLGLSKSRLTSPATTDRPLVVVDDCALTGHRFGEFLGRCDHPELIFATLYSPAALRQTIEAREPRVLACVSAHDLVDLAPSRLGAEYGAWRERMLDRLPSPRYWVGQPEAISFAWSEPEWGFWNPDTGQMESVGPLASTTCTLRDRSANAAHVPIRVVPPGRGPLRPAAHTLFVEQDGGVLVADTRREQMLMLEGVAGAIWSGIVEHGTEEAVTDALLEVYDTSADVLRRDVRALVQDLSERGLLCHDSFDAPAA